jgi:hypothetical protein
MRSEDLAGHQRTQTQDSGGGNVAPEPESQGQGTFTDLPRATTPDLPPLRDFPILSQIHAEVGTMASVVDQINHITNFIHGIPPGERTVTSPPRETVPPEAAPATIAPGQPPSPASQQTQAQPSISPQSSAETVPAPAPEATVDLPGPSEEEINELYDLLFGFVNGVATAVREESSFTIDEAFGFVSRVVDTPTAPDILYRRAIYTRESGDDEQGFAAAVVLHSVNVCIYCLKIGEGLRYNRDQLIDLGVSGLLHDLGMVRLPTEFFTKGKLEPEDIERLHKHPFDGHMVLSSLGENLQWLAEIALQEHERYDGTGYPNQIQGDQIHEYARIVGVADFYAGLTRSRHDRRGRLPFEAVKEIIQTHKSKFDPKVVRILLTKLSAFPIGSLVKLNSGASGRVVGTDETSPLRPDIQILYDAQGRAVSEDRVIKLREYSYGKHDSMETGHPIIRYYRRTLRHATEAWASTKKIIINQGRMFGVDLAPILEGADTPPTEPDDRPRSSMARVGGILLWIVMSLIILAGILWQIGFVRLSARQTGDRIEILRALSNPPGIEDPTKATPTYATSTAPVSAADTMGDRQKKIHENPVLPISSSSSVPLSASDPVSGTEPGPMEVNAGGFGVHLGSYRTRRSAERQVSTWKKHGLDTTVQIKQIPGRGTFFRLVAGPYPRFSAADSVAMRLRNQSWRPYARPIRIP